ncbi:MAG TPA: hypothetical protein VM936_20945 [Pyrinomonadaceae bacterium]|jgi:hypothetical protein|nr:hypothetical protein [Pyrinomonadaceae bacterium]
MKRRSTHALLALILLTCAQHVQAQRQPSARPEGASAAPSREDAARREELEKKAVALLREAVADAQGLRLVENRVRPQTVAASLLWARDEKAARALFKSAAEAIASYGAALDPEDPQFYISGQSASQMRSELINAVAQYDPKLALEYLRATRQPYAEALRASGYAPDSQEQQLEATLASRVASQDPAEALRMAEQSMSKGLTMSLVNVLHELRAKDPAAATKLATEIVKRLSAEDLLNSHEASGLAYQLLSLAPAEAPQPQPSRPSPVVIVDGPAEVISVRSAAAGSAPVIDRQTRAELVEKILAAAMTSAPNRPGSYYLYNALQALVQEFERSNPARAAALRRRAEALERTFNPGADAWRPYKQMAESGTVEAIMEAAPKAPPEVREQLYMNAAWKAFNEGDAARARQIAENISNPQQRAQTRKSMDVQSQWRDATQGNYAAARAAASRLANPEERVNSLMQIASFAASKGDAQAARQALDDARAVADAQSPGQQQFRARLQVAAAYAQFEPSESFEIVESEIARLNELLDAAAATEGFGQESFKEGELRHQYGYVWGEMVSLCTTALTALSPADFERAAAAAKGFRRPDIRATAELQLAQGVLGTLTRGDPQWQGRRPVGLSAGIEDR